MPMMGIRKVISTRRLKMKNTLPIMLDVCPFGGHEEGERDDLGLEDSKNAGHSQLQEHHVERRLQE